MEKQKKIYVVSEEVTGRQSLPLHEARVVIWWQHMRDRRELGRWRNLRKRQIFTAVRGSRERAAAFTSSR